MTSNSRKLISKFSSPKTASQSQSPPPPPPGPPPMTYQVCHELQRLFDQVFKSVPQTPHFNPLSDFSGDIKEGLKLGSHIAFLNLVKKFQNCDPSTFLGQAEIYIEQIKQFEVMGYDVSKLIERFKLLKRKVEHEKLLRDAVNELEEEEKQKEARIEKQKLLLKELTSECARIQSGIEVDTIDVESISSQKRKIMDDSNRNLNEFRKLAKTPL